MKPLSDVSGGAAACGGRRGLVIDPQSTDKAVLQAYRTYQHLQELCAELDGQLLEQDSARAALMESLSRIRSHADELTNRTRSLLATCRETSAQLHILGSEYRVLAQAEIAQVVLSILLRDRELSLRSLMTAHDKRLGGV